MCLGVNYKYSCLNIFKDGPELVFTFPQGLFCVLTFGDILDVLNNSVMLPSSIFEAGTP